ncbi:MAG: amidohydrolase family protein, partial [Vicinamibacteraceae bacterium]
MRLRRILAMALAAIVALAAAGLGTSAWGQAAPKRRVALVITNATVITQDATRRVLAPGAVAIDGTDIVGVDTPAAIAAAFTAKETIDGRGQIVLPGLINTHGHAPMVLFRGLGSDLNLMDWLQQYIFPAEAKSVTPAFVRTGTQLAALEMIRSGTTTFADMYYYEEEVARAASEAGL